MRAGEGVEVVDGVAGVEGGWEGGLPVVVVVVETVVVVVAVVWVWGGGAG